MQDRYTRCELHHRIRRCRFRCRGLTKSMALANQFWTDFFIIIVTVVVDVGLFVEYVWTYFGRDRLIYRVRSYIVGNGFCAFCVYALWAI